MEDIVFATDREYWWDALKPIYDITGGDVVVHKKAVQKYIPGSTYLTDIRELNGEIKVLITNGYLPDFWKYRDELGYKIVTYVHSPAVRSKGDVFQRFRAADVALSPSEACAAAFRSEGVTCPIVVVGWTKAEYFEDLPDVSGGRSILYMPGCERYQGSSYGKSGVELVRGLSELGFSVMLQPHPLDLGSRRLRRQSEELARLDNVILLSSDQHLNPVKLSTLFSSASLLITDWSGIQLEFGLTNKPIINLMDVSSPRRRGHYSSVIGRQCETAREVLDLLEGKTDLGDFSTYSEDRVRQFIPKIAYPAGLATDAILPLLLL